MAAYMRLAVTVALGGAVVLGAAWIVAQDQTVPPTPTEEKLIQGENDALLVANLVRYGQEHSDALALLTAAQVLVRVEGTVVKQDAAHDNAAKAHDASIFFSVAELLDQAQSMSDSAYASQIEQIASAMEAEGTMGYVGWLHTHWVYRCNYWGGCWYRYHTHY